MLHRPFLFEETACASYLFGCTSQRKLGVVDQHALVDSYIEAAAAFGSPIVAVFEAHVQADHVSGLPIPLGCTGAPPSETALERARPSRERAHSAGPVD